MKCSCCGKEILQSDRLCSHCGQNNEYYVEPVVTNPVVQPRNNEYYNPNRHTNNTNNTTYVYVQQKAQVNTEPNCTFAVLSLVFGLLGGWLGLVFGIIGLTKYHHSGKKSMCIIGIVAWAAWLILLISVYSSY